MVATIQKTRPDLLPNQASTAIPIPESPPPRFFEKSESHIEGIGEPMNACFFVNSAINPANWYSYYYIIPVHPIYHSNRLFLCRWVFEKYDGVRGFWNPTKKKIFSRSGKVLNIPQAVLDTLPADLFLDGELWYAHIIQFISLANILSFRFGRDNFLEATKLSCKPDTSGLDWAKFRYMVFDIPNHPGSYRERYNLLGIPSISSPFFLSLNASKKMQT